MSVLLPPTFFPFLQLRLIVSFEYFPSFCFNQQFSLLLFQSNAANLAADFSAIKELDSLSNEIVELQR